MRVVRWRDRALCCETVPIFNLLRVIQKERRWQQQQQADTREELQFADDTGRDGTETEVGVPSSSRVDSNPAFPGGGD